MLAIRELYTRNGLAICKFYTASFLTRCKSNPVPFSSIIQEKNSIEHKYVMGSILARNAISVFVQPKIILAVVAIGPYVFHAQY